ncbi:MAG: restriction endonuclease subunit S, partial [Fimbriimonadaceae bacterium]
MNAVPLPTLPSEWISIRLKWLLDSLESGRREVSESDSFEGGALSIGGEHIGWHGEWLLENPRYISREFFTAMSNGQIRENDILLVKDGATIGKVAIATKLPADESAVNEHVFLLRMQSENVPKYYFYFVQSSLAQEQIQLEIRGSAQPGLNSEFRNALVAPKPPRHLQQAIADYLDRETARIDALIETKEQVLALLAEKRRVLITRAITRGLDPHVPLRDSGIPWLGKIPAHWEVNRARWLFRERDVRSETGEEELLSVSHLTGVTPRSEKEVNMFEAQTNEGYKTCIPGNLVINTLWAWMGAMGIARVKGIVSPAYNVYQLEDKLEPSYIDALVRLPVFAQEVTRYSKGVWSSRLRLYPEGFFEVFLPLPALDEQRVIVGHIARETAKLDKIGSA